MARGRPKKEAENSASSIEKLQVKENTDLVRDTSTNAIINTNTSAYLARLNRRDQSRQNAELIEQNQEEIRLIKEELTEIKQLLKEIASK